MTDLTDQQRDALAVAISSPTLSAKNARLSWGEVLDRIEPAIARMLDEARAASWDEGRDTKTMCRCGHTPEQHDAEGDPFLCMVCGDNTHCDYADDEEIAADRWDEGYISAVNDLCPPHLEHGERILWAITHMPKDNPYRGGAL